MGKYKQWLHHQEVGARLRDEIAAHEAERERVLKLAPTRLTSLPDLSNPIIAALLGHRPVTTTPAEVPTSESGLNGASAEATATVEARAEASATTPTEGTPSSQAALTETAIAASPVTEEAPKVETPAPLEESRTTKSGSRQKSASSTGSSKEKLASQPPAEAAPNAELASQPDTIDPLLEQLLAQAESAPADPLEAMNLLASQGPNLTRGEPPQPLVSLPTDPLIPLAGDDQSPLSSVLSETQDAPPPEKKTDSQGTEPVAVGVEAITTTQASTRTEITVRAEKGHSDTDELVAARPTEGYTEPRLIVPQWLKSMELSQDQEGDKAGTMAEDSEGKQRFSVSLPFENEEDMRLHESVERWWQRWRQQS